MPDPEPTTRAEVEQLLARAGLAAGALHSDRDQADREQLLAAFRRGDVRSGRHIFIWKLSAKIW